MKKFLGYPKMLNEAKLGKPGHSWIVELLIFVLIFFIAQKAETIPITIATVIWLLSGSYSSLSSQDPSSLILDLQSILTELPEWFMILSLFVTAFATGIIFLYVRKFERRSFASMGFRKNSFFLEYVIGAAIGIVMITAALVISMLQGAIVVTPQTLGKPMVGLLLLWLAGYMLQGLGEEVMVRGYLMVSMTRKNSVWLSILLSSLVFALMHLGNPGIGVLPLINLFLSGLVFAVYIIKRGNIWGACAMHTFWNFYQGCIYGISVSGTGTVKSALFSSVSVENTDLWSGGSFGLEGSISVLIVEVVTLLIFLFLIPAAKKEQVPVTGPIDGTFTEVPDEPAAEPASEPVAEPVAEPAAEPVAEPVAEPASEPVAEPVTEPVSSEEKQENEIPRSDSF